MRKIQLDVSRDKNFSPQGIQLLERYYSDGEEGIQKAIARAANCYSFGDDDLAQFIYDAASKHWFFYSSPVLSNAVDGEWIDGKWVGEKPKALPIACFLTYVGDSIDSQVRANSEISHLSIRGGGTSMHLQIRGTSEKAPGPIPYAKTVDGLMGYYKQGKTRKGSTALYLDVSHPDILEFIGMRKPSGGDSARKIDNRSGVHHGINITDSFRNAVISDLDWELICPHTKQVVEVHKARSIWEAILEAREFTGEPYLYFIDVANEALPAAQKQLGLRNNGSNLCSEITLPTSDDRTAVCCLSSLNLEKWEEWKDTPLVENLVKFLDNVLQWFIWWAPPELNRAVISAQKERAIGIGMMGWHNYLMSKMIPFESGGFNSAASHNHRIFSTIQERGIKASQELAQSRGEPSDMRGTGRRNSHIFAIAPNANSSVLCNTSPSIEPINSNAYPQKSRAGITLVKNKYLERLLEAKGLNTDEVWQSIVKNNGSVQHLGFLDDRERAVFKTAWEIDQHWIVQHAGDRQQYICQAQSLNVFFLPGSDRAYINSVHMKALKERMVKSMYYFRTGSEGAADTVKTINRRPISDWKDDNVCVACEG